MPQRHIEKCFPYCKVTLIFGNSKYFLSSFLITIYYSIDTAFDKDFLRKK